MSSKHGSNTAKSSTRVLGTLSAAALAVGALPAAGAEASPSPSQETHSPTISRALSSGEVTWQDRHDNRYLEVYHSGTGDGNLVDAYPGNGTATQHWYAVSSGYSHYGNRIYGMVNAHSFKCLADRNGYQTHTVQWDCGYSKYTYRWAELSLPGGGWILGQTGQTGVGSEGWTVCENESSHWVYQEPTISVVDNYGSYPNCVWH